MAKLSDEAKKELKERAGSATLREGFAEMAKNRHNPFIINGEVDLDLWIAFLTEYNSFINHAPKPFRRIETKFNKL